MKSSDARAASATDHQQGHSRSHVPMGLSARIMRSHGFSPCGAYLSTQFNGGASAGLSEELITAEFLRPISVLISCIAGSSGYVCVHNNI
jgi:hypothetical protein